MQTISVVLVRSFTQDPVQGNPTGVVLDADRLTSAQMQAVATELGFAETAFVLGADPAAADYRTRFFSPIREVNFCGYATLATFFVLWSLHRLAPGPDPAVLTARQQTALGVMPVRGLPDGSVVMTQQPPRFWLPELDRARIARNLGLTEADLLDCPIQTVSTGTPKLMVPLVSLNALRRVDPLLNALVVYDETTGNQGIYPFTLDTDTLGIHAHARHFNPLSDPNEDPVTGVAAGALVAYLQAHGLVRRSRIVVEQGHGLGKSGRMTAQYRGGQVTVGGHAVIVGRQDIAVP